MAYPTDRTLYFRTDSTTGGDGTVDTTSGANRAFESLKAAIDYVIATDADLTGQGVLNLICTQGGTDSTALTSTSGLTTTATDYLNIECQGSAHHGGISRENSGTGYQLKRAGQTLSNYTQYMRVKGMEVATSGTTSPIYWDYNTATSDVRWDQCIFSVTSGSFNNSYCVEFTSPTISFTNCLFLANTGRGPHTNNASSCTMTHCGIAATGSYGLLPTANTNFTNCWSILSSTQDFWTSGGGSTGDYNASEDATANTVYTNAFYSMTLASEFTSAGADPASADCTLTAGSQLIGAGTGSESVDITGSARTGTADIGPFNYDAGGSTGGAAYFQLLNRRQ